MDRFDPKLACLRFPLDRLYSPGKHLVDHLLKADPPPVGHVLQPLHERIIYSQRCSHSYIMMP